MIPHGSYRCRIRCHPRIRPSLFRSAFSVNCPSSPGGPADPSCCGRTVSIPSPRQRRRNTVITTPPDFPASQKGPGSWKMEMEWGLSHPACLILHRPSLGPGSRASWPRLSSASRIESQRGPRRCCHPLVYTSARIIPCPFLATLSSPSRPSFAFYSLVTLDVSCVSGVYLTSVASFYPWVLFLFYFPRLILAASASKRANERLVFSSSCCGSQPPDNNEHHRPRGIHRPRNHDRPRTGPAGARLLPKRRERHSPRD